MCVYNRTGGIKMETKSRYEIIAELEEKKADLLKQSANVDLNESKLNISIEKAKEDLKEFLSQKDIVKHNIKDQLESLEKSLERFNIQKS